MSPIRIGILGAGRQGRLHCKNIVNHIPEAQVVAISDPVKENLDDINIHGVQCYTDCDKIFEDREIDAVIIASSTSSHEEMIEKACSTNKHIFCEKPIASDMEGIERSLKRIKESQIKFMIGFNRRFDPSNKKVSDLVQQGVIGQPQILCITSRDPDPPSLEYLKNSGGFFFDTSIHDFDMARYVMHDEIIEIHALANSLVSEEIRGIGDVDTTMISLKFKSGALGCINNSRKAVYGYDQRIEVFGSKGSLSTLNKPETQVSLLDEHGVHMDRNLYFYKERYPESFVEEILAFINTIKQDTEPPATAKDAEIAVLLAKAAKDSYEQKKPIQLEYTLISK